MTTRRNTAQPPRCRENLIWSVQRPDRSRSRSRSRRRARWTERARVRTRLAHASFWARRPSASTSSQSVASIARTVAVMPVRVYGSPGGPWTRTRAWSAEAVEARVLDDGLHLMLQPPERPQRTHRAPAPLPTPPTTLHRARLPRGRVTGDPVVPPKAEFFAADGGRADRACSRWWQQQRQRACGCSAACVCGGAAATSRRARGAPTTATASRRLNAGARNPQSCTAGRASRGTRTRRWMPAESSRPSASSPLREKCALSRSWRSIAATMSAPSSAGATRRDARICVHTAGGMTRRRCTPRRTV